MTGPGLPPAGRLRGLLPAALLSAILFAAWAWYFAVYRVDDAYIVYRYAENLAAGRGFVFNAGERVEGVSCFLWTLLLAVAARCGLPLPRVAPLLSFAAGLAVLLLLPGTIARARGRPRPDGWDLCAAALVGAHPGFAYWSVGALETMPYTLLVLLALRTSLGAGPGRVGAGSAVFAGLAMWIRPEAPLLAAGLAADRGLAAGRRWARDAASWAAIAAAVFAPLLLFRVLYFGDWLPNTYYAKTGFGLLESARIGAIYVARFFCSVVPSFGAENMPLALLGCAAVAALVVFGVAKPGLRGAGLLVAALVAAAVVEGGDWMVLHRFLVPALPMLALLAAAAAGEWTAERGSSPESPGEGDPAPRGPRGAALAVAVGLASLLLASFVAAGVRERDGARGLAVNEEGYREAHHAVARFLRDRARPGDVVALMDIGIIGYESGLRVLDISGLTNPEIARAPGGFLAKSYPPEAILDREPRFLVLVDGFPIDTRIALDRRFLASYRLVFERNHRFNWVPPESYTLHVFEKIEEPAGDRGSDVAPGAP